MTQSVQWSQLINHLSRRAPRNGRYKQTLVIMFWMNFTVGYLTWHTRWVFVVSFFYSLNCHLRLGVLRTQRLLCLSGNSVVQAFPYNRQHAIGCRILLKIYSNPSSVGPREDNVVCCVVGININIPGVYHFFVALFSGVLSWIHFRRWPFFTCTITIMFLSRLTLQLVRQW